MVAGQGEGGDAALALRDVDKRFGGTQALRAVSLDAGRGRVHALLGGNGSGKSTLVKILAGVYRADAGTAEIGGVTCPAPGLTPALGRSLGLRFVHQNPAVFATMSVAENLALGGDYPRTGGRIDWRRLRRATEETLERYQIAARPQDTLGDLRPAIQTMIAIARALRDEAHGDISILTLDEPTAALPGAEVDLVLRTVRRCAEAGQAILFVSHRIDEVIAVADDVTVLRDGERILTGPMADLTEHDLVTAIVGREVGKLERRAVTQSTQEADTDGAADGVLLHCRRLSGGPLRDASLQVRQGEIVGLAGLLGSGRTELLQMLFGCHPRTGGVVRVDGVEVTVNSPGKAMALGIAYVPEDREADALFKTLSVRENLSIAQLGSYWKGMRMRRSLELADARESIERFGIRTAGPEAELASLSGGNQQKVVMARWLRRRPRLLLLDEPTQGVDVGARVDLHRSVRAAVDEGAGALLVSSDFEELAAVSDRVLVLSGGSIVAEVTGADLTASNLTEIVHSAEEATS